MRRAVVPVGFIVVLLGLSACAPGGGPGAGGASDCPKLEVGSSLEEPVDSSPMLERLGLEELTEGMCIYEQSHALMALDPDAEFASSYVERARGLFTDVGAEVTEGGFTPADEGFMAVWYHDDGSNDNFAVSYFPSLTAEDVSADPSNWMGLEKGDALLSVAYGLGTT